MRQQHKRCPSRGFETGCSKACAPIPTQLTVAVELVAGEGLVRQQEHNAPQLLVRVDVLCRWCRRERATAEQRRPQQATRGKGRKAKGSSLTDTPHLRACTQCAHSKCVMCPHRILHAHAAQAGPQLGVHACGASGCGAKHKLLERHAGLRGNGEGNRETIQQGCRPGAKCRWHTTAPKAAMSGSQDPATYHLHGAPLQAVLRQDGKGVRALDAGEALPQREQGRHVLLKAGLQQK